MTWIDISTPVRVGRSGWLDFKFLFSGVNRAGHRAGQNRIYAVNKIGQLLSYIDYGTPDNVSDPDRVGRSGWLDFKFLFSGVNNNREHRIYAVNEIGQLLSYIDYGTPDNVSDPDRVGRSGWQDFKFLFSGVNLKGENRIYAVNKSGELLSYIDDGTRDNVSDPLRVGNGWQNFKFLFSGVNLKGENRIYGVDQAGELLSYEEDAGRTLFVARAWRRGADPKIFFTTIAGALAQAATMTPMSSNPVAVIISPGTYTENIDLESWVFLSSATTDQNAVTINGTVTWTPKIAGLMEVVQLYFLNITRPTTVTTAEKGTMSAKNQTSFILHGCFVDGLTVNGRSASGESRDFVFAGTSVPGPFNTFTLNKCLFEWVAGRLNGMTFTDCLFRIIGSTQVPYDNAGFIKDWSVNGTSQGICTGSNLMIDPFATPPVKPSWTFKSGTKVMFRGCSPLGGKTQETGAIVDIS